MEGITYIEDFLDRADVLFSTLKSNVPWDERMQARKTASFGKAYNYSQINYPDQVFLPELESVNQQIHKELGFLPNNCLINYYPDGRSKMGFHSDQTDILEADTGVVIVSLGSTRVLRFRHIDDRDHRVDYPLPSGSLLYMTQEVQGRWQHAIPKADTDQDRMSLTFRQLK